MTIYSALTVSNMHLLEPEMIAASCSRAVEPFSNIYIIKLLKHVSSVEESVIVGRNKLHTMAADYSSSAEIYPLCLDHIFQKQRKALVLGNSELAFGNTTNSDLKFAEKSACPALFLLYD